MADCYSHYSQDDRFSGQKIIAPTHNYLSGDWKSQTYEGPAYCVPSERRWIQYHEYMHIPNEARRDAIDMQSEDQWVDFCRHRDAPRGSLLRPAGIGHSGYPKLNQFGYTRDPSVYPEHTQFVPPARFPQWNGPGYYGYYHENLDLHDSGRYRDLPAIRR